MRKVEPGIWDSDRGDPVSEGPGRGLVPVPSGASGPSEDVDVEKGAGGVARDGSPVRRARIRGLSSGECSAVLPVPASRSAKPGEKTETPAKPWSA